ncbi:hypothetical protein ALC53_08044 [Atta colombica]|uniref:Uncharacterized protein n=1 Tax=Atta colombica TaxID=520822 RepID=A0A151I3G3_9HYME|nr:hypothetical protein ALC53_08044 [Atta colombica]
MYVDSRRSESFEDQSVGSSMRRDVLNSTSNKLNMSLISKGRAVLVDFVLRTDVILKSLGPDTILGMVFDLTNRYSSPECLLLFLNVPHNIFKDKTNLLAFHRIMFLPEGYACAATDRCFLLANCCAPRSGLPKRDAQSYRGNPPLSIPHEYKIMSPEESATTCSIASQISTIAQFVCNVARCAASALITVHLTPREKPMKTEALKRRHGNEDRFMAHDIRGWTSKKKVEPNCAAALRHVQRRRYLNNSLAFLALFRLPEEC